MRVRDEPSGFSAFVAMPSVSFQSRVDGVDQPESCAADRRPIALRSFSFSALSRLRGAKSAASGVGQPDCGEVETLSDVRRADARSAQIGGPDSIAHIFQVNANSSEPFTPILARNLLSKDD